MDTLEGAKVGEMNMPGWNGFGLLERRFGRTGVGCSGRWARRGTNAFGELLLNGGQKREFKQE